MTNREAVLTPHMPPHEVMGVLPPANYARNYQPNYPDADAMLDAMCELHKTQAVTTPRQVDALQASLTRLARDEIATPLIITGRCAEPVDITTPIETLVAQSLARREIVIAAFGLGRVINIERGRGQNTKPRTKPTELLADNQLVPAYMGDAVNSIHQDRRTPDPTRMVAAALQARDIEEQLIERTGQHIPAAHEALLLPYEHSFVRIDPETNKKYLLSTDLPWIGKRTNDTDGEHVRLLSEVANPIGVKIGPDSTPEHIAALRAKLNPDGIPGKLILMLRVGPQYAEALGNVVGAIKKHAPESLIMYDIHGVTRTAPTGEKIRYTGDIIEDIKITSEACQKAGLKLHGLHLETTADNTRLECVDEPNQLPTHPGGVDPQLNPRQTVHVLEQTKQYLL